MNSKKVKKWLKLLAISMNFMVYSDTANEGTLVHSGVANILN